MVDPPSTPPTGLRELMIYDIYQWKTLEKSYENYHNLCDLLRIENISFGDFEYWFNRYSKEYYYSVKNGRSLPILDISACVFSDFINGKSAENSYNQISEALGESIVKKEDFEKWRNSFSNGKRELSDEESQTQKIVNVIDRDPLVIRRRILEEFGKVQTQIATNPELWRKLTSRAHKRLCKAMGDDYVDYPEFEFWFSRFLQGNFDWGYDRSSEPKPRSLIDLPLDVFNKICENLKLHDRLRLRDVCKDIRALVDSWDLKVTKFWYRSANNWRVFNKCTLGLYQNPISFMMNMLKHPKFQLKKLKIDQQDKYWKELIRELDESNRKLHVKKVEFVYNDTSKIDLHFMIPGVLEEIKMCPVITKRKDFYEIIKSEQCQKAKMVYIDSPTATSQFPLRALYHCPRFTLKLGGGPAGGLKAKLIKKLVKKSKVQECVIYAQREIMNYFNEPEAMVPNFPSVRRYPIPETSEFYDLEYRGKFGELFVHLQRKQ